MDSPSPFDSPLSQQLPQSLPDSRLQGMLDADASSDWLSDDPMVDWNVLNDFYFCAPEPTSPEWPQWTGLETPAFTTTEEQDSSGLQTAEVSSEPTSAGPAGVVTDTLPRETLKNVSQWLDGAYHPPVPCSYCRRHRLQCLIIRTTSANPNPITSCSSCVALFRECSLSRGEKRLPSRFETFTPVLGHLHGLPEQMEDGNNDITSTVETVEERKESKQFVRKGARVLREWFYQNQEYPYPAEDQKVQLSRDTGFSPKRISTWFANARRRQKQKLQSSNITSTTRSRAGSPLITSTLDSMTPMERWQASPPEDEPVQESAIQDAIASGTIESDTVIDPLQFEGSTMDWFNFDETSSHLASSVSSFGSRASETSESASSAWSYQSGGQGTVPFPLLSKIPHSRRRRGWQRSPGEEGQYQCTFCMKSFRKRHDWSRHEKSVHLPLDSWVCTPDLNALQQPYNSQMTECRFCDTPLPTPAHWEEHEFHICAGKPTAERSFSRKDYLWQHLRKFHACTKTPVPDLEAWRGPGANVPSRCGFCNDSLSTWSTRAEHLAEHFKNGARMQQWLGAWGLDSSAMGVLRNAVLPCQRSLASPST